ncbi:universal stress protein [Chitinophaga polysaccharea]|uniref:universal stress protein n=1 Tax=Chitinophaga TaxID=79328 RepID=UPI0014557FF4|nr:MULTISPECIES: universal stress protein [Chitinophaga]NLR60487.1 universal stress protein [Chitinophaga polysaccharea]NLU90403.1 universal stress protein [Chitinophaga sp. Ak27]
MNYCKILIAVDDGPTAEKVASNGYQLAKKLKAEMALLSVVDTTHLMTDSGITPRELADINKSDFKKSHQLLAEKIFKDYKIWSFVEEGKPYEVILKTAEEWEADLIIIGTHGRTGLYHLLLGSIAEHVIRYSSIPVMIIPSKP